MFEGVEVQAVLTEVGVHDFTESDGIDAADRLDAVVALDRVIANAQALQYRHVEAMHRSRARECTLAHGDPALSVIGEVAMARKVAPDVAGTHFGNALTLATLPSVAAALEQGTIRDATARAIAREVEALCDDDRTVLDAEITPHLAGLTPGRAARLARRLVLEIDAEAARERARRARDTQFVTLLPEADGVAMLHVRGPAEMIVAAHRELETHARGLGAAGDPRTTGQIMCQTLVERVTGLENASHMDVELGIVISAETLLGADDTPADLDGYGPIPPSVADDILGSAPRAFYRRLITDPVTDVLTVRDPRRRRFDGPLAGMLKARDRWCRQPGCDRRSRELDHIEAWADGGITVHSNGQGLCSRSHTLKHQPGWSVRAGPDGTEWSTPTGHTYRSPTPKLLGIS
ncbi:DUF222 domain-containing protein [Aeromicrobium sp. CF4.19]|uniref:HNH endonuclease signature motif containing protein n=1 Tax=Aeromicrobium sp. CF4.19 TaxID=3373082 RepID=UPI003EE7A942